MLQKARASKGGRRTAFLVPLGHAGEVLNVAQKVGPDRYWLSLIIGNEEVTRVEGEKLKEVLNALDVCLKEQREQGPNPSPLSSALQPRQDVDATDSAQ
jgi:hypothetical protein